MFHGISPSAGLVMKVAEKKRKERQNMILGDSWCTYGDLGAKLGEPLHSR